MEDKIKSTKRPEALKKHTCCICKKTFIGYGNNPDPIKKRGRCCDECNNIVILERIQRAIDSWTNN